MTLIEGLRTNGRMLIYAARVLTRCLQIHARFFCPLLRKALGCLHAPPRVHSAHVMLRLPIVASIRGRVGAGRGRLQGHERQHCVFPCTGRAFSDVTGPTHAPSDGRGKNVFCRPVEKVETAARLNLSFATVRLHVRGRVNTQLQGNCLCFMTGSTYQGVYISEQTIVGITSSNNGIYSNVF